MDPTSHPHSTSSASSSEPPSMSSSQSFVNSVSKASSHFPYPVSYTVNALMRRLSSDPDPSPKASRAGSKHSAHSTPTPKSLALDGSYTPPKRVASPFQPPPLSPLSLSFGGLSASPSAKTLTKMLAEEIRLLIPPRLQLVEQWNLAYSLERDGSSLATLYQKSDDYRGKRGGHVLVIKDGTGSVRHFPPP
jgi:hypothetical protein